MRQQPPRIMSVDDDGDPAMKVVESLVLGVVNWWTGKFHRNQVLNLVTRHFQALEVHEASLQLAQACQPGVVPVKHNNTPSRSACEAKIIDLVNSLLELDSQKKKPRIQSWYIVTSLSRFPLTLLLSVLKDQSVPDWRV